MTLSEFKAWFEGFTEQMDGQPSRKQWKRIQARVAEIDDVVTPWPVFVERYITPSPQRWWYLPPIISGTGGGQITQTDYSTQYQSSNEAFAQLGTADYAETQVSA